MLTCSFVFAASEDRGSATLSVERGHLTAITSVSWVSDTVLASSSGDNTAKLWDTPSGALLRTITAPQSVVRGFANVISSVESLNGEQVLVGSSNGARLYDLESGGLTASFAHDTEFVSTISATRSGSLVAVSGSGAAEDGARTFLRILDSDLKKREIPIGDFYSVDCLAFSSSENLLLVAGARIVNQEVGGVRTEGAVRIYSTTSVEYIHEFAAGSQSVDWADFSPDGEEVFFATNGVISRYQIATGVLLQEFSGWRATVDRDGRYLAAAPDATTEEGRRFAAVVWRIANAAREFNVPWPTPEHDEHRPYVTALSFSPSGKYLAVGLSSGKLAVWEVEAAEYRQIWEARDSQSPTPHILAHSGSKLMMAGRRHISVWDLDAGKPTAVLGRHADYITAMAVSIDGDRAAAGLTTGEVFVWDVVTGAQLSRFHAHRGQIEALVFLPDSENLIAVDAHGKTSVHASEGGSILQELNSKRLQGVRAVSVSRSAGVIALGQELGEIHVFSLGDLQWKATLASPDPTKARVESIAFDGSGRQAPTGANASFRLARERRQRAQRVWVARASGSRRNPRPASWAKVCGDASVWCGHQKMNPRPPKPLGRSADCPRPPARGDQRRDQRKLPACVRHQSRSGGIAGQATILLNV